MDNSKMGSYMDKGYTNSLMDQFMKGISRTTVFMGVANWPTSSTTSQ